MLKNKILIKITGSIASYKVGYLISKLVQNGFEVKTVVTESALNFIGKATLEGLTNNHVYSDTFESNQMMSHISLTKWADLTILVPADANTINKFSAGIADNLVSSLFLAHDKEKPYLIAPAMNTAMYLHPATQSSLGKLNEWGIIVLPTEDGYLACGDKGKGKLLDPDKIYGHIIRSLNSPKFKKNILITSGGTKENIDNVRYLTNLSTGRTGAEIADYFYIMGHNVTFLKAKDAIKPEYEVNVIEFSTFSEIEQNLKKEVAESNYDSVIHLAAISDYSPKTIVIDENIIDLPTNNKINSNNEIASISLKRNHKIIDHIKKWSLNENIKLIGFKFVNSFDEKDNMEFIENLFSSSQADYVVLNAFNNRVDDRQSIFKVIDKANNNKIEVSNPKELAKVLEQSIKED